MVKGKKRCLALIHPQDAESRQLKDGDMALVSSRVGTIRIPVAFSDQMMRGVISIPHGWGHKMNGTELSIASLHPGVNTNILTDDHFLDSVSGNAALNGIPVSISRDTV
jgi:anaerobic selenocysteine-containing dehydrogenase